MKRASRWATGHGDFVFQPAVFPKTCLLFFFLKRHVKIKKLLVSQEIPFSALSTCICDCVNSSPVGCVTIQFGTEQNDTIR